MKDRGVTLDALTAMQVVCWLEEVMARSGCQSAEELAEVPALAEVSALEFGLYAQQRRKPGKVTLQRVGEAFEQTQAVYEVGPYNIPLWKILEGDAQVCMKTVDAELERLGKDLGGKRFPLKEKALRIWLHMLPEYLHHWKSLEELVAMPGFNIVAKTYATGQDEYTHINRIQGRVYSATLIAAVIALWMLCEQHPDSDADTLCRYMLEGLLEQAIGEEFSRETGRLLTAYLVERLAAVA